MADLDIEPELVTLRDGPTIAVDAIALAISFEDRGFALSVEEGRIRIEPTRLLTSDDRAAIDVHRDDLRLGIEYVERLLAQEHDA